MNSANSPTLETDRLILRRFQEQDLEDVFAIFSDTTINTFLPWFPLDSLDAARAFFESRYAAAYAQPCGYKYAICLKGNNAVVGYVNVGIDDAHDLGYGLRQEYWHKGIVSEACTAIVAQVKADGLPYITATHDVNNPRSGAVMQRLGMSYMYSYEELWQPKNTLVIFRMYQRNFSHNPSYTYKKYWDSSTNPFVEAGVQENLHVTPCA